VTDRWSCERCDFRGDYFQADRHLRVTGHAVSAGEVGIYDPVAELDALNRFAQRRPTAKEWLALTAAAGVLTVLIVLWISL